MTNFKSSALYSNSINTVRERTQTRKPNKKQEQTTHIIITIEQHDNIIITPYTQSRGQRKDDKQSKETPQNRWGKVMRPA